MQYRIRPAGVADVPDLAGLRTEAEGWLQALGTDQWSDPETGARAISKWRATIDDGRAWVISDPSGRTVGTVSRGPADRDFWRDEDEPESGFYVYKLMTSRSMAGKGLGSLVLDWSCRVATAEGRRWVRLDCWRTNRGLQAYYEQLGFEHVRTEAPGHRKSGWLAQRPSSLVTNPPGAELLVTP
uniref:GNAT family N-acetyltransferase n=1 Tax=Streptomyces venezuelae TaxID=54571 RepID=UPI001867EBC0|nr:GNAT family N-acetyltransferase [Streptomyces venezuelae]